MILRAYETDRFNLAGNLDFGINRCAEETISDELKVLPDST